SPANPGVSALLAAARTAYAARSVVAPAGHSAMEYYEAALAQDPGNKVARDALREIFPFAVPCVEQAIAQNELDEAKREISVLAKADPTNYSLTLLRSRLARQTSGNVHVLTVTATADSWIQVAAANGSPIDARTLRAGESRTYHSAGPLRVTLGNADGVTVSGDGQRLELGQHQRNAVAHLLLFGPDTLARAPVRTHNTGGVRG
ncbi:MAG: RodZ domain-containing protein, partial [Rhodanobacteraceae bacterium]